VAFVSVALGTMPGPHGHRSDWQHRGKPAATPPPNPYAKPHARTYPPRDHHGRQHSHQHRSHSRGYPA
jgi:hypothetical protein